MGGGLYAVHQHILVLADARGGERQLQVADEVDVGRRCGQRVDGQQGTLNRIGRKFLSLLQMSEWLLPL